jgi:transposase-like protein
MPKRPIQYDLKSVLSIVQQHPNGLPISEIANSFGQTPRRTLQYWVKSLVDTGQLVQEGKGKAARYKQAQVAREYPEPTETTTQEPAAPQINLSHESERIRAYLRRPLGDRTPRGYNRQFLEDYRANVTSYLTERERLELAEIGRTSTTVEAAGTYAKQILHRLLIDLSWNSSRLEGNTYSLLDTRRLIEFGAEKEGQNRREAQMILNHKDAIEFLVSAADEIGFNRYTVLNLHAALAQNLLADESAAGRLRRIAVGIEGSAFHPLEGPQVIEECFNQLLATAQAIQDPFEQAFFVTVQLPYLQPFDDVNKRVSRLAANIPFIKANLIPLSFADLPRDIYTEAMLGVYELNQVELLKDVFIWGYRRSVERYRAVRQSLGDPDPFKQKHRDAIRQLIGDVIRGAMNRKQASDYITDWITRNIEQGEREHFREVVETELLGLHEGNSARFQVRPSEFVAWRTAWENRELIFPAPNERHDFDRDAVFFTGVDGTQRISCVISEEALRDHFHTDGADGLTDFRNHRQEIEAVARAKYIARQVETDGSVAISSRDIAS